MSIIRKDSKGIYTKVGGYLARPINPTKFKVGQNIKTFHFGGSTEVGVGKSKKIKNIYDEIWCTNN